MPEGVISKLERILRNFFWEGQKGSKINHLGRWETVTRDLVVESHIGKTKGTHTPYKVRWTTPLIANWF